MKKNLFLTLIFLFAAGCYGGKCNPKGDIAVLTSFSDDKDRLEAADRLSSCAASPKINDALLSAADDKNKEIRLQAVKSLMEINKNQTPDKILKKLSHEDENVRFEIVESLGGVKNKKSEQLLIYVMTFDPSAKVRAQSAKSIGNCCAFNPGFVTYLSAAGPYGYYDGIRDEALYWPSSTVVVDVNAKAGTLETTAAKALAYVLEKDPDASVRESAAKALGFSTDKETAKRALIKALAGDVSFNVKAECAASLGDIGDEDVRHVLLKAAQSPNDYLRMKATEALSVLERGAY